MKKQKNTKQMLFEMMEKIDSSFKPKIISEARDGFERKVSFLIYSNDGEFLGETDPVKDEFYINEPEEVFPLPEFQKLAQENGFTEEQVGRIKREMVYTMNGNPLSQEYYSPSQSMELYDDTTNTWYNTSGQQMRDPSEYERYPDGTNQWGEYYDDEDY